jgi:uncharacterized membrane protein
MPKTLCRSFLTFVFLVQKEKFCTSEKEKDVKIKENKKKQDNFPFLLSFRALSCLCTLPAKS